MCMYQGVAIEKKRIFPWSNNIPGHLGYITSHGPFGDVNNAWMDGVSLILHSLRRGDQNGP